MTVVLTQREQVKLFAALVLVMCLFMAGVLIIYPVQATDTYDYTVPENHDQSAASFWYWHIKNITYYKNVTGVDITSSHCYDYGVAVESKDALICDDSVCNHVLGGALVEWTSTLQSNWLSDCTFHLTILNWSDGGDPADDTGIYLQGQDPCEVSKVGTIPLYTNKNYPYTWGMAHDEGNPGHYGSGSYTVSYESGEPPEPPIATPWCDNLTILGTSGYSTCYGDYIGEDVTDWYWFVKYPSQSTYESTQTDIVLPLDEQGCYDVNLTVTNPTASHTAYKPDYICVLNATIIYPNATVTIPGNIPTIPTIMETLPLLPVGLDKANITDVINQSMFGNVTAVYRGYIDDVFYSIKLLVLNLLMIPVHYMQLAKQLVMMVYAMTIGLMMGFAFVANPLLYVVGQIVIILPGKFQNYITMALCVDLVLMWMLRAPWAR